LQILASVCRPRLCLTALAEEVLEEITKPATTLTIMEISRVKIPEIEPVEASTGAAASFKRPMAELIVFLAEFWVAQDMIGFRDFLKAALGLLVARIKVGMEFPRQASIGLFDLFVGRRPLHA
jgi:hypothetical protein